MNQQLTEKPKRTEVDFAVDQKLERALLAVAAFNGNTRKASAFLKETDSYEIPHQTLWYWARKEHVERYEAIRREVLPHIRAQAADEHMELAELQMEANRKIVTRLTANIDELPIKELAGASRNMSVGAAVETEKAQLLNDQPTHRSAVDLLGTLQELKALGVEAKRVLNLEAEEISLDGADVEGAEVSP